jgi:anthranilate synthase component II
MALQQAPPCTPLASAGDLIMIDNYDSFTYNIVQYFEELGVRVTVYRHDQISVEELEKLDPQRIVISPGPGAPKDAGISCDVIKRFAGRVPILGVCLGTRRT